MSPHPWRHPGFTAAVAAIAWAGVLLQLVLTLRLSLANGKGVVDALLIYLGYFTVLTNIVVATTLALARWGGHSRAAHWCREPGNAAGVLVSIALVGLAYHALLRQVWNPQGPQWVADNMLHYATPLLCALHWWLCVPPQRLAWTEPLRWALWPLAYLMYALLRGAWLNSYPYPFIDVAELGYGPTLVNAAGLLLVFLVLGWVLVALARARAREPDA